jgi:MFS family permease
MPNHAGALLSRIVTATPLRHVRFRRFYLGSVGTALGYTMTATISAWLMATLTPSALMVALVQTASTLPSLLFGMIAGALADIVDRRRVLMAAQVMLLVATLVLGAATIFGVITPLSLLALTFLIGAAFTFYLPTQQAMINDLVPHAELPPAVALGALAFNVSRAVGPAVAGGLTAWVGSGSSLLLSALLFAGMILAVHRWRRRAPAIPGIPETLVSGVQSGIRFIRHSAALRAMLQRNMSFSFCASALWALLPVIARDEFATGAGGYGLLFGVFGAGAVVGAVALPRHLRRTPLDKLVTMGSLAFAVAMALVALTPLLSVAILGIGVAGGAWTSVLASLSAGVQSCTPAWVRARALAMNLVSMQASLAAGAAIWGSIATIANIRSSLGAAAAIMVLLMILNRRAKVALGHESDLQPGVQLPELTVSTEPMPDDGPVLIQVEYRVAPENHKAFLAAIHSLEPTRRRNGASAWRLFRDLEDPERFLERFVIGSWAEYVRLRLRFTMTDSRLREEVSKLQRADVPVRVSRLLGVDPRDMH